MEETNKKSMIAPALIVAAAIIAGAIIYTQKSSSDQPANVNEGLPEETSEQTITGIKQTSANDHIFGSPTADITILLYSDIECPYCKTFHATLKQTITDGYGKSGRVNWVYRHFPLTGLHPTAFKEAEATECAAELGGKDKFWEYLDRLVTDFTPSQTNIINQLAGIAEELGIQKNEFVNCLTSGKYEEKIKQQSQEAIDAGARGTPFVILMKNGNIADTIPGALTYEQMKMVLDDLLLGQ